MVLLLTDAPVRTEESIQTKNSEKTGTVRRRLISISHLPIFNTTIFCSYIMHQNLPDSFYVIWISIITNFLYDL
jgi:hypothetical protein